MLEVVAVALEAIFGELPAAAHERPVLRRGVGRRIHMDECVELRPGRASHRPRCTDTTRVERNQIELCGHARKGAGGTADEIDTRRSRAAGVDDERSV